MGADEAFSPIRKNRKYVKNNVSSYFCTIMYPKYIQLGTLSESFEFSLIWKWKIFPKLSHKNFVIFFITLHRMYFIINIFMLGFAY